MRRKAIRSGLPLEEVRKQYELIPKDHMDIVMDRLSLKKQATTFERKARKITARRAVDLPNLSGGAQGVESRSAQPELR